MAGSDEKRRAHFTYIWKIESVPRYAMTKSPMFTVQSMEMTKWNLNIYTMCAGKAPSQTCTAYLQIERQKDDNGPESIEVEYELGFLDNKGSPLCKLLGTENFRKTWQSAYCVFSDNIALFDKREDDFFPKDPLTIRCRLWRKGTDVSKSELCFASTQFDVHKPSCVWAVKGFSSLKQGEKRIRILCSAEKGRPQLILTLSLAEVSGKECAFIHLEAPNTRKLFAIEIEIAVLDSAGIVAHSKRISAYVDKRERIITLSVFEKSELIAVLLSDDVLLLRCELQLLSLVPVRTGIEDYKLTEYPNSRTAQSDKSEKHFDEMHETATVCPFKETVNAFKEDGTLSDVSLQAGTESFLVHKLILGSRSNVFRAMFTKDTSKSIDFPDLDADTLRRLLLYIYGNKVTELNLETAANLFEAADKHELLALKEKCASFLKSILSESNVCKILALADVHHDEGLKKAVQEFIQNNSEIMDSDIWKIFREDNSKLALETAEQIIYNIKHSRS